MKAKRGNTLEVPRELLAQLVLKHLAEEEGLDLIDLFNTAHVDFVNSDDKDSDLDSVVVTWTKR